MIGRVSWGGIVIIHNGTHGAKAAMSCFFLIVCLPLVFFWSCFVCAFLHLSSPSIYTCLAVRLSPSLAFCSFFLFFFISCLPIRLSHTPALGRSSLEIPTWIHISLSSTALHIPSSQPVRTKTKTQSRISLCSFLRLLDWYSLRDSDTLDASCDRNGP
jgi:hypothetical protein